LIDKKFLKKEVFGFLSVFVVLFSVYMYSIAPTVSLWDCGEFIACAHILGVAHPPGTPFYILLGRVFDILIPFNEVAKRINFFSVLCSTFAGGFLYLIITQVLRRFKENKNRELSLNSHLIAIFSSIGAGFCFSVWDSTVEAEVYAASILILTMGIWLVLRWDENRGKLGNSNLLLFLVYLLALSFGLHLLPLLLVPGALLFVLLTDWKVFKNPKFISFAVVLIVIGVSTYLTLLIRAHASPGINESDPTNWVKLWEVIRRKQYGSEGVFGLLVRHTSWETNYGFIRALIEQLKVFFKYFSWQFFPYPREITSVLLRYVSIVGTWVYVLFGFWGMYIHHKKDRKSFYLIFILFILVTVGLVFYLNHEFSQSDPNPAHQPREPRERDYFWSSGFFFFMFYVALALHWIYGQLKKRKLTFGYCVLGLSVVIGFTPLISNIKSHANRRGTWIAHESAYNYLVSPKENSILFTNGDNDTFPLWFLQEVKGFRRYDSEEQKGVRVACLALMNTEWYVKQLKADGIPMDFASPFRGTRSEAEYLRKKRSNQTNLEFEEWIIENLTYLPTKDRKILQRKDIVIRNIILTSQGIKPTFTALTLSTDTFVDNYIRKDFNPSINIYFLATVSPGNKSWLEENLVLEGFAYRLVGSKGRNMMDVSRFIDLFENKLSFDAAKNPDVYIGPSEGKILNNYAIILYRFGSFIGKKLVPSKVSINIDEYKSNLNQEDKEQLKYGAGFLELSIKMLKDEQFYPMAFNDLRQVYQVTRVPDHVITFFDELTEKNDSPILHFFKGQILLDKLLIEEKIPTEQKNMLISTIENEFKSLMNFSKKETINAYTGLFDLYSEMGEEKKKEELVEEILQEKKIFSNVFVYNYDIKRDTAASVYLLKKWLEVNRNDKEALDLLKSLGVDFSN